MKLFTKVQMELLLKNGEIANLERMGEVEEELSRQPVVKLFTPWGSAIWLISELDPDNLDIAFGLCDLGMGCPELGSVSITELQSACGPLGMQVERDLHWTATKPLVAYADDARLHNAIQA